MLLFQSHGKYGTDGIAPNTSNPFEKRIKVILTKSIKKKLKKVYSKIRKKTDIGEQCKGKKSQGAFSAAKGLWAADMGA